MLYVKGDYYLNEFISALKHAIELAIPVDDLQIGENNNDNMNKN